MILALDLATKTGWAAGEPCGLPVYGTWHLNQKTQPARFLALARHVREAIQRYQPGLVVLESAHVGRSNPDVLLALFGYRAVAMLAAYQAGPNIESWPPQTIRKHFIGIGINFSDYERLRAHIATWSKELQGYELEPELDRAHTQIKKSLEHTMQAVRIEAEKYTESLLLKEIADKKTRLSQNTEAIMKLEAVLGHLSSEEKALSLKPSRDQVEQLTKRLEVLEQLRAGLKTVSAYK